MFRCASCSNHIGVDCPVKVLITIRRPASPSSASRMSKHLLGACIGGWENPSDRQLPFQWAYAGFARSTHPSISRLINRHRQAGNLISSLVPSTPHQTYRLSFSPPCNYIQTSKSGHFFSHKQLSHTCLLRSRTRTQRNAIDARFDGCRSQRKLKAQSSGVAGCRRSSCGIRARGRPNTVEGDDERSTVRGPPRNS